MIRVYGTGLDIIVIEGRKTAECNAENTKAEEPFYLAFSDGTVISAYFDDEEVWRLNVIERGKHPIVKHHAKDNYPEYVTDIIVISGDVQWIVAGEDYFNDIAA